jgi:hypothetical protein
MTHRYLFQSSAARLDRNQNNPKLTQDIKSNPQIVHRLAPCLNGQKFTTNNPELR